LTSKPACAHSHWHSQPLWRTSFSVGRCDIDLSAHVIAVIHCSSDASYVTGREKLPFPDESFGAVINVEAAHAYPQLSGFLGEVARELRPGGHFLYADFRGRNEFSGWDGALADMPLRQLSARVLNADVLRSLDKNSQRSLELIGRQLPAFIRPFGRRFAGVPGTGSAGSLKTGTLSTGCTASPKIERRPVSGP
jgi:SAM-dependent methyltransferase